MANIRFNGTVQDVAQVTTSTASGTFSTGDKVWATIGTSTVEVTLGATVTLSQVASSLGIAINASDKTTGLVDETRNIGGQTRGEFRDVVATYSGAVLTLTSVSPGVDFTVTFGDDSSGTMGAATEVTAATGKNWFNNAGNWDGGSAPGSGDIPVFSNLSVACTRGLNTITNIDGVTRLGSYTADIGLPLINTTHTSYPYPEYRNRFLLADKSTDGAIFRLGDGTGKSTGITKINNYQHDAQYYINDSAPKDRYGNNAIEIISDDGGTGGGVEVYVINGTVDIGMQYGDYTAGTGCEIEHIKVWGGFVRIEGQVEPASELALYGGQIDNYTSMTNFSTLTLEGGKLIHHEGGTPGMTIGSGCEVDIRSNAAPLADLIVMGGGSLTFDNDYRNKSMINMDIRLYDGARFSDVRGVAVPSGTGEYFFLNSTTNDNISLPENYSYAPTAL